MGKGDKKTAKGKRVMGSYGVTRQKKQTPSVVPAKTEKPAKEKKEAVKKETVKKPVAKKAATPKAEKVENAETKVEEKTEE